MPIPSWQQGAFDMLTGGPDSVGGHPTPPLPAGHGSGRLPSGPRIPLAVLMAAARAALSNRNASPFPAEQGGVAAVAGHPLVHVPQEVGGYAYGDISPEAQKNWTPQYHDWFMQHGGPEGFYRRQQALLARLQRRQPPHPAAENPGAVPPVRPIDHTTPRTVRY